MLDIHFNSIISIYIAIHFPLYLQRIPTLYASPLCQHGFASIYGLVSICGSLIAVGSRRGRAKVSTNSQRWQRRLQISNRDLMTCTLANAESLIHLRAAKNAADEREPAMLRQGEEVSNHEGGLKSEGENRAEMGGRMKIHTKYVGILYSIHNTEYIQAPNIIIICIYVYKSALYYSLLIMISFKDKWL